MSKHIAKRTFDKNKGLAYAGDILENIPEPYLSDWLRLGLIEAFDATSVFQIPEYITTGTAIKKIEIKRTGGKPKKAIRK